MPDHDALSWGEIAAREDDATQDLIDNPPDHASAVAELYRWAWSNPDRAPWAVFLDLIGWSDEHHGRSIGVRAGDVGGYAEVHLLGKALVEYAHRPTDVLAWIEETGAGMERIA
jgi:hypothetical protein